MISSVFSTGFERFLPSCSSTEEAVLKAAIDSDCVEDVMGILKSGDLLVKPLPNGELPLNYAIRLEKLHIVKKIFQEMKPNIEIRDDQGLTFIDHAVIGGNPEIKALVLECFFGNSFKDCMSQLNQDSTKIVANDLFGEINRVRLIDMSESGEIHLAARDGDLTKLQSLVALGGNINQSDCNGLTPLHYACLFGQEETVRWLLRDRTGVEVLSRDRKSALHFAAIGGHSKVVEILLASTKLSPNVYDAKERTPLHYASLIDNPAGVAMLIQKGANPLDKKSAVTPVALLMYQIQKQSDLRDPLKLDTLSMVMFAGFVGSWMLGLFSKENSLQALDWVSTASAISLCLQNLQKPQLRRMFGVFVLLTGFRCSKDPDLQEVSYLAPSAITVGSAFEGIKKSWRGLAYETYRPLRNIAVHVFSGVSSLCGLVGRAMYIKEERDKSRCHGRGAGFYHEWNEEKRICELKKDSIYKYGSNDLCNVGDWIQIGDCMIESGKNLSSTETAYRSDAAKVLALPYTTPEKCDRAAKLARRSRSSQYFRDHCNDNIKKFCQQEPQRCPNDPNDWCYKAWLALSLSEKIACDAKYRYSVTEY